MMTQQRNQPTYWNWERVYGVPETREVYRVTHDGTTYQAALRLDGHWYADSFSLGAISFTYSDMRQAMDACARTAGLSESKVRHTWSLS